MSSTTKFRRARRVRQAATLLMAALAAGSVIQAQTIAATGPRATHTPTRRVRINPQTAVEQAPLTAEEQAAQILNRFSFGPRPGEVAEVTRTGWDAWFERQLDPAGISDAVLEKRLAQYPALGLAPQQLAVQYPDGQVIRRIAEGKQAMPTDPQLAGVYEVLLARYQRKQAEDKADAATGSAADAGAPQIDAAGKGTPGSTASGVVPGSASVAAPANSSRKQAAGVSIAPAVSGAGQMQAQNMPGPQDTQKQRRQQQKEQDRVEARMLADQILGYSKNLRMQAIFRLPVEQRMALTAGIAEPEKSLLTNDMTPHEKELFGMMAGGYGGSGVIASELQQAKVLRAVLSERQLQEVMTDFWFNHFNIDLTKNGDELNYAASYERDAIRAHALGKFRDLLLATAEHPAMLIYLDNFQSIGPDSQAAGRPRPNAKNAAQQRGLNENYGREVMELHTVGVDGGYTQADVTNLAKVLTGWTIDQPQMGGGFVFEPRRHEPGAKQWFGQRINEDGMNEGVRALSWLAAQPQTAHFLSYKLAQRFVADVPPPALVNRMAAAYLSSDGDMSAVLRAMVHAPEFFARANYRTKVKMPLEYVASSLRATDTDPANPAALANELKTMGEPLYRCLPPTGYASTADKWMNSAALVDRLNFALQLTGSKFGGMRFDATRLLAAGLLSRPGSPPTGLTHAVAMRSVERPGSGQEEALDLMERLLVPGAVSEKTNAVIRQQMEQVPPAGESGQIADPSEELDKLAAMILGSPEFQVH